MLDELPTEFREQLHNLEIVVQKRPSKHQLAEMDLDSHGEVIYGLYEGVPLPDRSAFEPPILPDKITLFTEQGFGEKSDLVRQDRRIECGTVRQRNSFIKSVDDFFVRI